MKKTRRMGKIRIVRLTEDLAGDVARLLRRCFPIATRFPHAPWNTAGKLMTGRLIERRVLSCPAFDPNGSFVALAQGRVAGFCLAGMPEGKPSGDGYLCALAVEPLFRRQGIGSFLLSRAERYLARRGARRIRITFEHNTISLLGGVPMNEEACPFLLNRGFRSYDRAFLQVMTQDTTRFRLRRSMRERIRRLETKGIRIGRMERRHLGSLDRLLARHFGNWHGGIMARFDGNQTPPILVALERGRVLGFAGPFGVTDSGLGNFFALGVTPAERGNGLGVALFHKMCAELKSMGVRSIALTTELSNPAQEIYTRAGFRRRFVVDFGMRKELMAKAK